MRPGLMVSHVCYVSTIVVVNNVETFLEPCMHKPIGYVRLVCTSSYVVCHCCSKQSWKVAQGWNNGCTILSQLLNWTSGHGHTAVVAVLSAWRPPGLAPYRVRIRARVLLDHNLVIHGMKKSLPCSHIVPAVVQPHFATMMTRFYIAASRTHLACAHTLASSPMRVHRSAPPHHPPHCCQPGHIAAAVAVPTSTPASADDKLMLIGGQLVQAEGGRTTDVINPTTGRVFTRVPDASKHDLDRAVAGAFSFNDMSCNDRALRVFLVSRTHTCHALNTDAGRRIRLEE